MSATVLYTPEVLALATGLARWPWDEALPLTATARSRSCGSTLAIGLGLAADGTIERIGLRAQACAVGQAAAAIFAEAAPGLDPHHIAAARDALARWLSGEGAMPDWPGLEAIAAASAYPARHGAMMLAWNGASEALFPDGSAR